MKLSTRIKPRIRCTGHVEEMEDDRLRRIAKAVQIKGGNCVTAKAEEVEWYSLEAIRYLLAGPADLC